MHLPYNQNHFTQEVNFTTTQRQHGFRVGRLYTHLARHSHTPDVIERVR